MSSFKLPTKVTVTLIKSSQETFPLDNILLYIKTYARHKNDFYLGPFASNKDGVIVITKTELENEVDAAYDSGLMDYSSIEDCFSFVEIRLYDEDEISRMIETRTSVWKNLLKGENQRWNSMSHLIDTLKNSNNKYLRLSNWTRRIRTELNGSQSEYKFNLHVYPK